LSRSTIFLNKGKRRKKKEGEGDRQGKPLMGRGKALGSNWGGVSHPTKQLQPGKEGGGGKKEGKSN